MSLAHARLLHAAAAAGALILPMVVVLAGQAPADADAGPEIRLEDPTIDEASGLAYSSLDSGVLFTIEDATNDPVVFALDGDGRTRARVSVPGVENVDWEDVAVALDERGNAALWIADTGDAYFAEVEPDAPPRTAFAVIHIAEPVIDLDGDLEPVELTATDVVVYPVVYPDGRNHNVEAMLVLDSGIYLVDKVKEATTVWAAPFPLRTDQPNTVEPVATIALPDVTAATNSGTTLAIRNYTDAYVWQLHPDGLTTTLAEPGTLIPLPSQRQGEGLAFTPDGTALLLSSEGEHAQLLEVGLPVEARAAPAPPTPSPTEPVVTEPAAAPEPAVDVPASVNPLIVGAAAVVALLAVIVVVRWLVQRRRKARTTRLASHHADAPTS